MRGYMGRCWEGKLSLEFVNLPSCVRLSCNPRAARPTLRTGCGRSSWTSGRNPWNSSGARDPDRNSRACSRARRAASRWRRRCRRRWPGRTSNWPGLPGKTRWYSGGPSSSSTIEPVATLSSVVQQLWNAESKAEKTQETQLTNRMPRRTDRPLTISSPRSTREARTMTKSKTFHPLRKKSVPKAPIFRTHSVVKTEVKTWQTMRSSTTMMGGTPMSDLWRGPHLSAAIPRTVTNETSLCPAHATLPASPPPLWCRRQSAKTHPSSEPIRCRISLFLIFHHPQRHTNNKSGKGAANMSAQTQKEKEGRKQQRVLLQVEVKKLTEKQPRRWCTVTLVFTVKWLQRHERSN